MKMYPPHANTMYVYDKQQSVDQKSEPVFTDLIHMKNVMFIAKMAIASLS